MATEASQLLLLLNWMSPTFPTGAFAYSHGLEWAIENGAIQSGDDATNWIRELISRGSLWNDAVLFVMCWTSDASALNEITLALSSSRERYLETIQLGRSFSIAAAVFIDTETSEAEIAYPVAAGMACRTAGIARETALLAYLQGMCCALVSVAVRLVPIGQTAGLRVLKSLIPIIVATAERAVNASLEDLGSCALLSDVAAMKHETMSTRIFRT